jgi:hypothetical protein
VTPSFVAVCRPVSADSFVYRSKAFRTSSVLINRLLLDEARAIVHLFIGLGG